MDHLTSLGRLKDVSMTFTLGFLLSENVLCLKVYLLDKRRLEDY